MSFNSESTLAQSWDPICDESLICNKTMCNYSGSIIHLPDQRLHLFLDYSFLGIYKHKKIRVLKEFLLNKSVGSLVIIIRYWFRLHRFLEY